MNAQAKKIHAALVPTLRYLNRLVERLNARSFSPDDRLYREAFKVQAATSELVPSEELFMLALRYKLPDADESQRFEFPAIDRGLKFSQASRDFNWSAAVAAFGMLLRSSPYKGNTTYAAVFELAQSSRGPDLSGYRTEFLELVEKAKTLSGKR